MGVIWTVYSITVVDTSLHHQRYKLCLMGLISLLFIWPGRVFAQTSPLDSPGPNTKLVLLTWPDYLSTTVVQAFERSRQVTLELLYYESGADREQKLALSRGQGYDLVLMDAARLQSYAQRGWLEVLSTQNLPNRRYIDPKWLTFNASVEKYGMPYFWGTLGIAYRSDKIQTPVTRWMQLFRPEPAWKQRILMLKDSRDMIGLALKALGYPLNSTDELALQQVEVLLKQQQPFVLDYGYLALNEQSALVSGAAWMSMAFNGDAILLQQYNPHIQFVVPEEGTNLWLDCWIVYASSARKALALDFLNFINEPVHAAQLAQELYYATPNQAAYALLPPAFLQDQRIYPSAAVLSRSESYQPLSPKGLQRYNNLFFNLIHASIPAKSSDISPQK